MDADQVHGALQANWLSSDVLLRCEIWSHPEAPGLEMWVDPHAGAYTCDFSAAGWDLLPDQMIAVTYFTPDGHRVINIWETQPPEFSLYLPVMLK